MSNDTEYGTDEEPSNLLFNAYPLDNAVFGFDGSGTQVAWRALVGKNFLKDGETPVVTLAPGGHVDCKVTSYEGGELRLVIAIPEPFPVVAVEIAASGGRAHGIVQFVSQDDADVLAGIYADLSTPVTGCRPIVKGPDDATGNATYKVTHSESGSTTGMAHDTRVFTSGALSKLDREIPAGGDAEFKVDFDKDGDGSFHAICHKIGGREGSKSTRGKKKPEQE